jgi:hypothetical protein
MNFRLWYYVAIAVMIPSAASAMPVSMFLPRVEALQKKGPMALFSKDLEVLTNQVKADLGEIRSERLAAKTAGQPAEFCPPPEGGKFTDKDIISAMRAVPVQQRASTSTKSALKALLIRRYPCP